jgi:PPOX class probable F420-dependent enzyme
VSQALVEPVRSLLEAPSPAVLTTYRKDGSAHTVPVWYRRTDDAFEVVIAKGDVKLRHLARDPRCVLVVFEAVRPFRGVEARGVAELVEGDVTSARVAIAGRYLGVADGERFAADRRVQARGALPARPGQFAGMGPVGNPGFLIDLDSIDRPAVRGACGLAQLGVACLGIRFLSEGARPTIRPRRRVGFPVGATTFRSGSEGRHGWVDLDGSVWSSLGRSYVGSKLGLASRSR